jgi:hypothetical protein
MITIEQARKALGERVRYATVFDFDNITTRWVKGEYSPEALAIDVLTMPLDKATTLPHFVVLYLYNNKDRDVAETELRDRADEANYRPHDVRALKDFFENTQSNVGVWYDSTQKKTFYRWYEPNEMTDKAQECLNRGELW